jgi:hypothetical protein
MSTKSLGGLTIEIAARDLAPAFPVEVGSAVKLDWSVVERTTVNPPIFCHQRNIPGMVVALWRPAGWPPMCRVDFGGAGEWRGPTFMLRSAYSDA